MARYNYLESAHSFPADSRDVIAIQKLLDDPLYVAAFNEFWGFDMMGTLKANPKYRATLNYYCLYVTHWQVYRQLVGSYVP